MQGLDLQKAQEIMQRIESGARVDEVHPLSGTNSGVWSLACASGLRVVVKTFAPQHDWQMAHERYVYELVGTRSAVPVPRVLLADCTRSLLDRDFIVMTHVSGTEIGSLRDLSREDTAALYRLLGSVLRKLHAIAFDSFGFLTPEGVAGGTTNGAFVSRRFAEQLRAFRTLEGSSEVAGQIESRIADSTWLSERRTAALCHNDLHEGNAFAELDGGSWRVTGIVDVGGAIAADPLFDLARTHLWSAKGDTGKEGALIEGYGPEPGWEEPLRLYCLYHALELRNHFARNAQTTLVARLNRDIGERLGNRA